MRRHVGRCPEEVLLIWLHLASRALGAGLGNLVGRHALGPNRLTRLSNNSVAPLPAWCCPPSSSVPPPRPRRPLDLRHRHLGPAAQCRQPTPCRPMGSSTETPAARDRRNVAPSSPPPRSIPSLSGTRSSSTPTNSTSASSRPSRHRSSSDPVVSLL